MKITIYELLGMIKDGKAPKRIRYNGCFTYTYTDVGYVDENTRDLFFEDFNAVRHLTDEVEILDNKKIKKLKKVKIISGMLDNEIQYIEEYKLEDVGDKINEIIDKINEVE